LQMGQTASTLSHPWMQSLWNKCPQLRVMTGSPASYSQQQIAQQSAQGQTPRTALGSRIWSAHQVARGLMRQRMILVCNELPLVLPAMHQWRTSCALMQRRCSTPDEFVGLSLVEKQRPTHLLQLPPHRQASHTWPLSVVAGTAWMQAACCPCLRY
jgi:hypothetical protein